MKKSDILVSLIIGEIIALFFLFMAKVLDKYIPYLWLSVFIMPVLSFSGLYLAYFLGSKRPVFSQLGRFILTGALNTVIDFGVLNLLIFITDISTGVYYSVFKAASGTFAIINSFVWNKFWTFGEKDITKTKQEAPRFLLVTALGFLLNVSIASFVVNIIGPQAGIDPKVWANIGALIASAIGLVFNFLGYKFIAFKS